MTSLSGKIARRSIAMLAAFALLGVASLLSVLGLQRQVHNMIREYSELREVQKVSSHAAIAIEHLKSSSNPDLSVVASELRAALESVEGFAEIQEHSEPEGSKRHEAIEDRTVKDSLATLRAVIDSLSVPDAAQRTDWTEQASSLENMQRSLRTMANEADALVAKTQQQTRRSVRNASLALGITFVVIAVVAISLSVSQYRGIMGPVRALRDGVRRIARGKFDQRLPAQGEREFIELTDDFNRMAGELDELYRDLETKVAAKSRELVQSERLASVGFLAAGLAHEINNPLGIMSGFAELSLKNLRNAPDSAAVEDARRSLQIIRDEAFRCREITEKLLTMSRGGGSATRSPVDLHGVIEDVATVVGAHTAYRDRRVEIDVEPESELTVIGDDAELRQVLLNLCVNGLEAVDPLTGIVRITCRRDGDSVELAVEDNGCGMTDLVREHIFEPFFSVRRGNRRSTGLGLSITRAIIESLGGSILVESAGVGRGSRFTAKIPACVSLDAVEV
jgi:two-component system, NtrC family, sensor kinase